MEKIGDYYMLRSKDSELGKGSFSIVYLGTYNGIDNKYIKNGMKVAIKVITTKNFTIKAREILEDEISIMTLIKEIPHPNIVGCYDIIKRENELYIIMEYCDSGHLESILKKPIKEKYAQFYFCQLANGLKYLDKNSIIHRDIKPKNILLTDNRRVLKIADFGFAKRYNEQSLHETICGSPMYMSPEIMNNNRYNNQTDLWSIGLILYEMLYAKHPFEKCKSMLELKDNVSKKIIEIPPSDTKNKDVSIVCIELLKKLLEKRVVERIKWEEFFENPWVKHYQYDNINNSRNEEYEKQLHSISLGSLNNESSEKLSGISPTKIYKLVDDTSDSHVVKVVQLDKMIIVDDYFNNIDKTKSVDIPKVNDTNQDYIIKKIDGCSPDEYIFEMDIGDKNKNGTVDKKKLIVRSIIENSSILDENKNYGIIESV
jgi:serine/threonine protein kinase